MMHYCGICGRYHDANTAGVCPPMYRESPVTVVQPSAGGFTYYPQDYRSTLFAILGELQKITALLEELKAKP